MRYTKDIETGLYDLLSSDGYSASAHALPATLGSVLPHIHVERTGGTTQDMVLEPNQIDFDVYDADPAEAMSTACRLCGWVRNLEHTGFCYSSEVTTLPYDNPDPRHSTISRATFKALIYTRTLEV